MSPKAKPTEPGDPERLVYGMGRDGVRVTPDPFCPEPAHGWRGWAVVGPREVVCSPGVWAWLQANVPEVSR